VARFGRELFPLDSGLRQACLEFCIRRLRRQLETLLGPFEIVIVVHCSLLPETYRVNNWRGESSCAISNRHENEKHAR